MRVRLAVKPKWTNGPIRLCCSASWQIARSVRLPDVAHANVVCQDHPVAQDLTDVTEHQVNQANWDHREIPYHFWNNICPNHQSNAHAKPRQAQTVIQDHQDSQEAQATMATQDHQEVQAIRDHVVQMVVQVAVDVQAPAVAQENPVNWSARKPDHQVCPVDQVSQVTQDHQDNPELQARTATMAAQAIQAAQDSQEIQVDQANQADKVLVAIQEIRAHASTAHRLVWHQATKCSTGVGEITKKFTVMKQTITVIGNVNIN